MRYHAVTDAALLRKLEHSQVTSLLVEGCFGDQRMLFCQEQQVQGNQAAAEAHAGGVFEQLKWLVCLFVGWLLNVPATRECISGTDLLGQFYVLPHRDGSCKSNFPSHPVTVY